MSVQVEYTAVCDGVREETVIGMMGVHEGECARRRQFLLSGEGLASHRAQIEAKGWIVTPYDDYLWIQCPDCHSLSPVPALVEG